MVFAVALAIVQRMEGTPLYFCVGCLLFLLIATLAFNTAGGLTRASGAYIFFYSVLVVVIGIVYKAFLGERADSNLQDPRTTIEVYVAGISAMFVAAFLGRRFTRRTPLFENILKEEQMYRASVGCILAGLVVDPIFGLLGERGEVFQSAFAQLNFLIPVGIIIGVIYEIRRSGGRRSVNLFILAGMVYYFVWLGLFGFSKQGMLVPLLSWFIAAWCHRYRFSRTQALCVLVAVWLIFRYLVPFAQYGRGLISDGASNSERAALTLRLLEEPEKTRNDYNRIAEDERGLNSYYNTSQGFWDRLQFVSVDDALINVTDQGKVFGLLPLEEEALNVIPRVFWPDKPSFNFGNIYAHEIGGFSEEDTTTGISFSPTAEAYHMAKWKGVLVVAPLLWFLLFTVYDSLLGDLRSTPWGLLAAVVIAHAAPETALTGVIRLLTFGTETLIFCALFAAWVAPLMASGVLGPGGNRQKAAGAAA